MTTISSIKHEPLVKHIEEILNDKFDLKSKVVRILEIGCGPGDFALIFKEKLGSRVDYTGMDPSDDIDKAIARSNGADIKFVKGDIFEHTFDTKYDLIFFSKSLHHCNPVDKAVKIAFDLLDRNGILFAEEMNPNSITLSDKYWYFERFDLMYAANVFMPAKDVLENAGYVKKWLATFLNTDLPMDERFNMKRNHHHQHGDHHHGDHQHGDHQHGDHHRGEPKKLHRDDPEGIAPFQEIITVIERQFEKVETNVAPFFFGFLSFAGLKDTEAGQAVLKEFMRQEDRAIKEKKINPFGINIIAYKN